MRIVLPSRRLVIAAVDMVLLENGLKLKVGDDGKGK
jgi:hypothetical protein